MSQRRKMQQGTYFANPEFAEEMMRLYRQSRIFAHIFRGTVDASRVHDLLDLACGPGEWALSIAQEYQDMRVTGVDISERMIRYAQVQATSHKRPVTFRVMDILQRLDFPDASFDLINARLITSFMERAMWIPLLAECLRVLRPGGILRLTEPECLLTNDSQTSRYIHWWVQAFHRAGHTFSDDPGLPNYCVPICFEGLLREGHYTVMNTVTNNINFSTGTEAHEDTLRDAAAAFKTGSAFLKRYVPDLADSACADQKLEEAQRYLLSTIGHEGFSGYWCLMTVLGKKPE